MKDKISWWIYALAIATVFLVVRGYSFNQGDQAEHLPMVYKMFDPGLYPADYFVTAHEQTFTVRFFYIQTVYYTSLILGVPLAVFLLTLVCISLTARSFSGMALTLSKQNVWAGLLAPVFVLFLFFNYFSLATTHIQSTELVSGSFGLSLSAWAIHLFLKEKYYATCFFLGLAALFHIMFAFNIFVIIWLYTAYISTTEKKWMRPLLMGGIFFAIAGTVGYILVKKQMVDSFSYDKDLYYQIQYKFRNFHHFYLSLFRTTHFIKFFGLTGMAFLFLLWKKDFPKRIFLLYFIGMVWLGTAAYFVGLEVMGIMSIGKTQWPKGTTHWAAAISALALAVGVSKYLKNRPDTRVLLGLSVIVIGVGQLLLWNIIHIDGLPRYKTRGYALTDAEKMYRWISVNTEKDALFLIPPNDDAFTCEAKRSTVSGYRAIVHEPWFMMPWFEKLCRVYHVQLEDGLTQNVYDILDSRYYAYDYITDSGNPDGIKYRLVDKSKVQYPVGEVVHEEGDWVLEKIPSNLVR